MSNTTINTTKLQFSHSQIFQLAFPIAISIFIPQINYIVNAAFMGRSGNILLVAHGIACVYFLLLQMMGNGFNQGVQVLLSRRAGENNKNGMGAYLQHAFVLNIVFAIAATLFTMFVAPYILVKFIHTPGVAVQIKNYLSIRQWAFLFIFLSQLGNSTLITLNFSRFLVLGAIVSCCTNIALDSLLIFGTAYTPALGIKGTAWASTVADVLSFTTLFLVFYYKKLMQFFSINFTFNWDSKLVKSIFLLSTPLIFQSFLSIGAWLVFFVFVEHLGPQPAAISNLMRVIFGFFGIATWSLASSCNTLVGNALGQQMPHKVLWVIKTCALYSLLFALIVSLLFQLFPEAVMHLFSSDTALIKASVSTVVLITLSTVLMSVSGVVFYGVSGTGSTKIVFLIELVSIIAYLFYVYYVVEVWHKNLVWAWGSEFLYWAITLTLSIAYLKWGKWQSKKW